jgi:hypothetical protein
MPDGHDPGMKWLIRLLFLRLLGRRAVPILALVGLVQAARGTRARDVEDVDPKTGRVRTRSRSRRR